MNFPIHKAGLHLEHNAYRNYYQTIEEGLAEEAGNWISPAERAHALATESIWTLHWYPNTPVGFNQIAASTLEASGLLTMRAVEAIRALADELDHVGIGGRYNLCSIGCLEAWARRIASSVHYVRNLATAAEDR